METIQCVTSKRNKEFNTPVGKFTYRYLNIEKYRLGILVHRQGNGDGVFIASPEKAIVDIITLSLAKDVQANFEDFISDLRIDEEELLAKVKLSTLRKIVKQYNHTLCLDFLSYIELKKECLLYG